MSVIDLSDLDTYAALGGDPPKIGFYCGEALPKICFYAVNVLLLGPGQARCSCGSG
jgi:hypothetical protein